VCVCGWVSGRPTHHVCVCGGGWFDPLRWFDPLWDLRRASPRTMCVRVCVCKWVSVLCVCQSWRDFFLKFLFRCHDLPEMDPCACVCVCPPSLSLKISTLTPPSRGTCADDPAHTHTHTHTHTWCTYSKHRLTKRSCDLRAMRVVTQGP